MSLQSYFKNYRFPVVFTRAANVFGPGQQLYRIVPRTILFARLGKTLQLHGGGASVRSFIHIRDVACGTLKILRAAEPGEVFHLSTERQISIRQLVESISDLMNIRFADLVENADERPGKDAAYLLDSRKMQQRFGWIPEHSLEVGLKQTIDWVDANFEALKSLPLVYEHKP